LGEGAAEQGGNGAKGEKEKTVQGRMAIAAGRKEWFDRLSNQGKRKKVKVAAAE
jgi:hypothetical protein